MEKRGYTNSYNKIGKNRIKIRENLEKTYEM